MIPILAIAILFLYEPTTPTQPISAGPSAVPKEQKAQTPQQVTSIRRFFKTYNSVLADYAQEFYDVSKAEGLDYRLLPAISMVESTGARNTPSCARFNPFGWSSSTSPCGFYRFENFNQAIKTVGTGISRNRAYNRYKQTQEISELAEIYNPGGAEKWAQDVEYFINKLNSL